MTKTIKIEGMSCMHCVGAVTKELEKLDGISNVNVSLEAKQATVDIASDAVTDDMLREAVDEAGFTVNGIV